MNALLVVDVQNDFLPGGALAVPDGDRVVPVINALMPRFDRVVATQDWHPPSHGSFAANHPGTKPGDVVELDGLQQILWPVHCVPGTPGAKLAPGLDRSRIEAVFRKGTDPRVDSYSAFFDNAHRRSTGLGEWLRDRGVEDVYLCGLALDYCVLYSALDAATLGFRTTVIEDATRGIERNRGDVTRAIRQMKARGVCVLRTGELRLAPEAGAPSPAP